MSNLEPHPSLPARPPQSSHPAPPRAQNPRPHSGAVPAFAAFTPRSVASRAPAVHMSPAPAHHMMTSQAPYQAGGYQSSSHPSSTAYYQQQQQQQQQPVYGTSTPPVLANPYQTPVAAPSSYDRVGGYDPEEAARIAEWQSAYTPDANIKKGPLGNANATALGTRASDSPATPGPEAVSGADGPNKGKEKTVVRQGGGKSWEDPSLLEWDPLHPRLFVGNLAGEVTDDSLMKAFSKYPSVSKARVIRDKKSTKSKSYGFVSFANTDDYFRAAKEMEGKYIGSHPVRIKRANTEIVATTKKDDRHGKHGKKNNNNSNKKAAGPGPVISGAPTFNGGIHKSHKKNGGPRLLG